MTNTLTAVLAKDAAINSIWDEATKELTGVMWEVDTERLQSLAETFLQVIQDRAVGDTPDAFQNALPF